MEIERIYDRKGVYTGMVMSYGKEDEEGEHTVHFKYLGEQIVQYEDSERWAEWDFYLPSTWEESLQLQEDWGDIKDIMFERLNLASGHGYVAPGALYTDHDELDLYDGCLIVKSIKAYNI